MSAPLHCLFLLPSSSTSMIHSHFTLYLALSRIETHPHSTPYDGAASTSKPSALPHRGASSTTATVPRRSSGNRRCNRSKLFRQPGPTYTPYHMMVESRPPNLLLCLILAPLRLRRRYHADPLLNYAAIVVYIYVPIAIYAEASSFADQDQPTNHTI